MTARDFVAFPGNFGTPSAATRGDGGRGRFGRMAAGIAARLRPNEGNVRHGNGKDGQGDRQLWQYGGS